MSTRDIGKCDHVHSPFGCPDVTVNSERPETDGHIRTRNARLCRGMPDLCPHTSPGMACLAMMGRNRAPLNNGYDSLTGQTDAFLLTPVPVRTSGWMLFSALGGLGAFVRRRADIAL